MMAVFKRTAAFHQAEQDFRKTFQRLFGLHEILRGDAARFNDVQRFAEGARRVVEAGLAGDLGVMQQVGIELDARAAGRAAEEIHDAAAAQHFDRPVPGFRTADGFDHDVGAAAAGQFANRRDGIRAFLRWR